MTRLYPETGPPPPRPVRVRPADRSRRKGGQVRPPGRRGAGRARPWRNQERVKHLAPAQRLRRGLSRLSRMRQRRSDARRGRGDGALGTAAARVFPSAMNLRPDARSPRRRRRYQPPGNRESSGSRRLSNGGAETWSEAAKAGPAIILLLTFEKVSTVRLSGSRSQSQRGRAHLAPVRSVFAVRERCRRRGSRRRGFPRSPAGCRGSASGIRVPRHSESRPSPGVGPPDPRRAGRLSRAA